MAFETNSYELIKNAISLDVINHCNIEFELYRKMKYITHQRSEEDLYFFSDHQISKCFSAYSLLCFETLMLNFLPVMEKITQQKLYPTYSYARIYYNGSEMVRHTDRPSCEYSATVCVSNDENFGPWEIWFENLKGEEISFKMEPGDALVYKGDLLPHWRLPYGGQRQAQTFFHYINRHGKYRHLKFDERAYLGIQKK